MHRPKFTRKLVLGLTGGNNELTRCLHHGLDECRGPLSAMFPHLDLDELVAFVASSRKSRERDFYGYAGRLSEVDTYGIFMDAFEIGLPWLKKYSMIPSELQGTYMEMNPYNGRYLSDRLRTLDLEAVRKLKEIIFNEPKSYVFSCQFGDANVAHDGSTVLIKVMTFQNVFPKSGKIVPAFVAETSKILRTFPREMVQLTKQRPLFE